MDSSHALPKLDGADNQAVVEQFEVGGAGKGEFLGNVESFGFSANGIF